MKVIVGLGNPGKKYDNTRHNIGFEAIDYIADKEGISINTGKHKALIGTGYMAGEKVLLVKPQTFMNLSGESLRPIMDFYKLDLSDILVIYDDISLEPGMLRLRTKGSAGGHNGIKSIIAHLGSDNFPRLKFGVGDKPKEMDLADYVLGRFSPQDEAVVSEGIKRACEAVECMIGEGCDAAMNKYNG